MPEILKVVLVCSGIGAVIGAIWAGWLAKLQPGWQSRYANPKKWYSWVFGPVLCTVFSVGHFVEGRPYLGGTFLLMAAVAFFFLLASAISSSTLKQG
jgi:hypothetical protein